MMSFAWYLIGNILSFFLFGWWVRSVIVRRLKPERILSDLETEVRALMSEVNQTGDNNVTLIEDRVRTLNQRITAADARIAQCTQLVEELDLYLNAAAVARETPVEESYDVVADEPTLDAAAAPPPETDTDEPGPVQARRRVVELYHRGFSTDIISVRTGMTAGEVELIISLHERSRSS